MKRQIVAAVAAIVLFTPVSFAQTEQDPAAMMEAASKVTAAADFVKMAANGGMFEVQSSEMAVQKAQSPEIKSFAEQMVTEHTQVNEKLKTVAQSAGTEAPPTKLDDQHQAMIDKLNAASGAEFDRMYKEMQTQAHQTAVALFTSYSTNGDNEALKSFAAETLPSLKQHTEKIQQVQLQS